MQLPFLLASTLLLYIGLLVNATTVTEQVPRIIFNGAGNCSLEENTRIEEIFKVPARRDLIRTNPVASRALATYPAYCSKVCAGYAPNTCRSPSYPYCRGYRRLQDKPSCEVELDMYQSKLDTLRHNVSESCRLFIGDRYSRTAECLDKIEYGEIVGARLWKGEKLGYVIMQDRLTANNYSFCKSTYIAIEAINDPCVKEARMELVGPSGFGLANRTEYEIPYSLFGDIRGALGGRFLNNIGTYTLKITPDRDFTKTRTWRFNVTNC